MLSLECPFSPAHPLMDGPRGGLTRVCVHSPHRLCLGCRKPSCESISSVADKGTPKENKNFHRIPRALGIE